MSKTIEYHRPKTRTEAIEMLTSPNYHAAPFIVNPKPIAPHQMKIDALIDLSDLELDYIQETPAGIIKIGALTTLQEMVESPILMVGERSLLNNAICMVAGPGIRNLCGIWGSIQDGHGPSEVSLALLALEAQVVILDSNEKEHSIPFRDFHAMGTNALLKGGLILEVQLPIFRKNCGWALERVSRTPRDESIVATAVIVEAADGLTRQLILALAGATPQPGRLLAVENMLTGKTLTAKTLLDTEEVIRQQVEPNGDFRGGSEYRRAMAGLIVRRALKVAWEKATGKVN